MEKIKFLILSFVTVLISTVFYSCSKDVVVEEEKPVVHSLDITSSNPVIPQSGGNATITFTTTDKWIATIGASWISISQSNGLEGSNSIIVTATENDSYVERNGNITITAGNITKNVTVTQKQKDALLVTSNKIEVKTEGGDALIEVKTNVDYEVKVDESCKDWISVVSTRALSTYSVTLKVLENKEITTREGKVSIVSGSLKEDVSIYQNGTAPSIVLSQKEYTVSSEGDTIKVELQSNTSYSVQMPGVDWISESTTRAMSSYTHYFNVSANEEYDSRSAKIIFIDNENNVSDTVKIIQAQKDAILIADSLYRLNSESQDLDFAIQSNIDFTVEVSVDWIKQVETRSLSTTKLYFNVEENAGDDPRVGYIILKANDIKQFIKVTQEGADDIPYVRFYAAEDQIIRTFKEIDGMEYSVGNGKWTSLGTEKIHFGSDLGELRLRNKNVNGTATGSDESESATFIFYNETPVTCSGDIRTLIDYENYLTVSTASARFSHLFENCTQLTSAPSLPATNIASGCYYKMFCGCKNLAIAPELPATWLDKECYYGMFSDCTGLTTAPKLPATTLGEGCYCSMFSGCTNLTSAPKLPAKTLLGNCYREMFLNCENLNYIKMLATNISATCCLEDWVSGVADDGTFIKNGDATWSDDGVVPSGWIVKYVDSDGKEIDKTPYLKFSADSAQTLTMSKAVETLEYSVNMGEWGSLGTKEIHFGGNLGALRLRGKNSQGTSRDKSESESSIIRFSNQTPVTCSGDVRTLVDYENYTTVNTGSARFCNLFLDCTQLTTAPELPATNIASYCYYQMFSGCINLKIAPKLRAAWLDKFCYEGMFKGCASLISAPILNATNLDDGCYSNMFFGCTSLTSAPELPAANLADSCYSSMFYGCTSLTNAPDLPAKTLEDRCYDNMFRGCSNINYIKMLATDVTAIECLDAWTIGVSSTGTFIKNVDAIWDATGDSGVPDGWTVIYFDTESGKYYKDQEKSQEIQYNNF